MSRTVDQKVVEMKFDNKQFESAVNQSRQSIKLMEKDLSLLDGTKALANLDKAISSVDFTHMARSIDSIKGAFSTLGTVGRSIINKMTTDAMNNLQNAASKIETTIKNLGKQIYDRGYRRASNLENSAFKIEGLLKRSEMDALQSAETQKKLSDMINESVTDTAFGLDQASLVASTLASTFGTDEQALLKIHKALNAVSGVAGTTGAAYEQVADIFTDAAGKGKAMGDEFSRMSLLGISAQEEVARYVNKNIKLQGKLNKILKKNQKHVITGDEILTLASKRKIDADIFVGAFEGFIDTAKEANDTMEGITDNIGAAIGRLGALFIQPIIANRGPLVQFLQVVKDGISSIAKVLDKLEIPKMVTTFFNEVITDGTKHLKDFVDEFKKGATPLNDFFNKAKDVIDKLTIIFSLTEHNTEFYKKFNGDKNKLYDFFFPEELATRAKDVTERTGKSYKKWQEYYNSFSKNKGLNKEQKWIGATEAYLKQMHDGAPKTLKEWESLYRTYSQLQEIKKSDSPFDIGKDGKVIVPYEFKTYWETINNVAKSKAGEQYAEQQKAAGQSMYDAADAAAKLHATEVTVFGHDWLGDIWDGIVNIGSSIADIFKTIGETIDIASGPLKDFFDALSGDSSDEDLTKARKLLNSITEAFKNATERFKEFVNSDEGKTIIKTISGYVMTFIKIMSGVFTIIGKIVSVAAPLVEKVFTIIDKIFSSFTQESKELDTVDIIINGLCSAIEWLGDVLDKVLDIAMSVVDWLKENGVFDLLGGIISKIGEFGSFIFDNWPKIWDTITGKLKEFKDWVGDKIGPIIEKVKPHFDDFAKKIKDLTKGFVDLKNPIDGVKKIFGLTGDEAGGVTTAIEKVDTALGNVKDTAKNVKDTISMGFGGSGKFKGAFAGVGPDLFNDYAGAIEKAGKSAKEISDAIDKTGLHSKKDKKRKKSGGILETVIGWIANVVQWFSKIGDRIKKSPGIFKALGIAVAGVAGAILGFKIATTVRELFSGIRNFTMAMSGGDARAVEQEAKADKYKAIFKVIIGIIGVIAAFVIATKLIANTIKDLGKIDTGVLIQGMIAFALIAGAIFGIVFVVCYFAKQMSGSTDLVQKNDQVFNILGKFGFTKFNTTKQGVKPSAFLPLIGIASVIAVFAGAVAAIGLTIKMLGRMDPNELTQGMDTFLTIGVIVIGLVALVLAFAWLMLNPNRAQNGNFGINTPGFQMVRQTNGSMQGSDLGKLGTGIGMTLFGVAAVMFMFSSAVTKIAATIKLLSLLPESSITQGMVTFGIISAVVIGLVSLVLFFAFMIVRQTKSYPQANVTKNLMFVLLGAAAIMFVFALSTKMIIKAIANLAVVGNWGDIDKATKLFGSIAVALILLVGLVFASVFVLLKFAVKGKGATDKTKAISSILLMTAVVMAAFGLSIKMAMKGIAILATALKDVSPKQMDAIQDILYATLIALIAIVAIVMGSIFVLMKTGGLTAPQVKQIRSLLIMISVIMGIVGGCIIAIGLAAMMMKDVDKTSMKYLIWGLGIVAIIIAALMIFAVVAEKIGGIQKGIKAIQGIMIALGVLFVLIGGAAYLIGKGADLFVGAIERFMDALNRFATMKDKNIKKGASKVGLAVREFMNGLIDGIIKFGDDVGGKKEALKQAITNILNTIQESITTFWVTLETNILDRLGQLIDKLYPWLMEYGPKLQTIFQQLKKIVFYGVIAPFLTDLGSWLWAKINEVIDWIANPENTSTLGKKLVSMFVSIIRGLVDGMEANRDALVEAVQNLIFELVNIIFDFFGLTPPFTITWTAKTTSEKAELEKSGEEVGDSLETGMDNVHDKVVDKGKSFIKDLVDGILQSIAEGLVDIAESWGNGLYDALHPDEKKLEEYSKQHVEEGKKILAAYEEANKELDRLMAHGMSKKAAIEQIKKNAKGEKAEYLKQWQTASPSKWTEKLGENLDKGLANGIKKDKALAAVDDTTEKMKKAFSTAPKGKTGKGLIEGLANNFKNAIPKISKVIENSGLFDTDKFIIKPGMDLSEVTKDSKKLQKIFDGVGLSNVNASEAIGLFDNLKSGNFNKIDVSSLANGFDSANDKNKNNATKDVEKSLGSINFTQNNYSPKSLSQIDIYRQTENLLGKQSTLNSLASSVGLTGTNF